MQECSIFSALAMDMYSSLALSHRFDITASLFSLQWRHNEHDGLTNHQRLDGLLIHLSRRISKKTSTLRVTGLCKGNSPVTSEFPAQRASNTDFFFYLMTSPCVEQSVSVSNHRLLVQQLEHSKNHNSPLLFFVLESLSKTAGFPSQKAINAENVSMLCLIIMFLKGDKVRLRNCFSWIPSKFNIWLSFAEFNRPAIKHNVHTIHFVTTGGLLNMSSIDFSPEANCLLQMWRFCPSNRIFEFLPRDKLHALARATQHAA